MDKPTVGQKLYLVDCGNLIHRGKKAKHRECTVEKVGRKFFYLSYGDTHYSRDIKFFIDSWTQATDYSANYRLFNSKQEYLSHVNAELLSSAIREAFSHYGETKRSLEQLKSVAETLDLDVALED